VKVKPIDDARKRTRRSVLGVESEAKERAEEPCTALERASCNGGNRISDARRAANPGRGCLPEIVPLDAHAASERRRASAERGAGSSTMMPLESAFVIVVVLI
jgi:hypothetical protein